jgi:hypothetical protein
MSIPKEEGNVSCERSWPITFTQPQLRGIKGGQHRNLLHTIPSTVFRRAAKQPKPAKNEIGKLVNSYLIKYQVNLLFYSCALTDRRCRFLGRGPRRTSRK